MTSPHYLLFDSFGKVHYSGTCHKELDEVAKEFSLSGGYLYRIYPEGRDIRVRCSSLVRQEVEGRNCLVGNGSPSGEITLTPEAYQSLAQFFKRRRSHASSLADIELEEMPFSD